MPNTDTDDALEALMAQHRLPSSYRRTVIDIIEPLALSLYQASNSADRPLMVGIHGAQGTGKSTLTDFLRVLLAYRYQCPTASLSLDDLYHTRKTRAELAGYIHPLLATRGVPGTHDLKLGLQVLDALMAANAGSRTPLPVFNKALDDREPEANWPLFIGLPDIILLEGWCVGIPPQADDALAEPVNALEADEDPDGRWRQYVNDQLRGPYKAFFDRLEMLIMLRAPSMEAVLRWRTLQEHRLADVFDDVPKESVNGNAVAPQLRIMSDQEVVRFIMHYERLTRHALRVLPEQADVVLSLAEDHQLTRD